MALHIIAGKHRGRRVETPEGRDTRPTSARTREAVFNILSHGRFGGEEFPLQGSRVGDIFCGSGAMGLEALSRGASHVTFVDQSREAIAAVQYNVEKFGEQATTQIVRADSSQLPRIVQPVRVLFVDPPYRSGLIAPALKSAHSGGWLDDRSIVVFEQSKKEPVTIPIGFTSLDDRVYGNTRVLILKLA